MRAMSTYPRLAGGLVCALGLALTGCATTAVNSGFQGSLGPTLSVERFLHAANTRDHHAMARLFGTADGPLADTGSPVGCMFKRMGSWIGVGDRCATGQSLELRMDAIARILRHEDYLIRTEEHVAGRIHPTTRVSVDMDVGSHTVADVPFLVVRAGDGSWLVQEIGLSRLTS